jgi:2-deoxy-D-gluconate 3-dehydrogenase
MCVSLVCFLTTTHVIHPRWQSPVRCSLQVIDVNLKSVWLLCQAAGRHMTPLREGKIINFCSLMSYQGGLTVPAYAAAKGALGQLIKSLSNEWSQHNVQVNGLVPGYIATDM